MAHLPRLCKLSFANLVDQGTWSTGGEEELFH